jgi:hypothetical protein
MERGRLYWELRKFWKWRTCPLYRGSVRGTWMEGYYTRDSERHGMEGSGYGKFLS